MYAGICDATIPTFKLGDSDLPATTAAQIVRDELMLDGNARLNLATFVSTWMEPEASELMAESFDKNIVDRDEYPQSAELEKRCVNILAHLWNSPDDEQAVGCSTTGSSEAAMLGALALKRRWEARRRSAGLDDTKPNMVMGINVQICWEKFCRYFDVEPRIVPLQPDKYTIGAEDVEPHIDENTIGVAAVLGTTFTGHADDIRGINDHLVTLKHERGLDVPLHVDAASGGFVWPFLYPHSEWDFRLEQVRSINVSGHKFGLVYPGVGWLVFREKDDLPEELIFYENYLGKRDATFTLNFSTGSSMVLAQYYNFVRLGHAGYHYAMETMKYNARILAQEITKCDLEVIGSEDDEQLPLVAFKLSGEHSYDEFDVSAQLAAERGWMVPAYTLPPNAEHVKIMRVLVKQTLGNTLIRTLGQDIANACATLHAKGGVEPAERKRKVKTNTGF
jgi:glutamate decarboxylase